MAYCRECPYCGANLDPGEHCNCREEKTEEMKQPVKITYQPTKKYNASRKAYS